MRNHVLILHTALVVDGVEHKATIFRRWVHLTTYTDTYTHIHGHRKLYKLSVGEQNIVHTYIYIHIQVSYQNTIMYHADIQYRYLQYIQIIFCILQTSFIHTIRIHIHAVHNNTYHWSCMPPMIQTEGISSD